MRQLFFIAIIPPHELAEKVTAIKSRFADRFASSKALRLMPHITLKPPFELSGSQADAIIDWFENVNLGISPFEISLDGFGAFERKHPVIFIKPDFSEELNLLRQNLIEQLSRDFVKAANREDDYFHPHVTVAYRDLTAQNFAKAWPEYRSGAFRGSFTVGNLHLLRHDGVKWIVAATNNLR